MSPYTSDGRKLAEWLANALIDGKSQDVVGSSAVACRERLGGLLKFYYREAA